MNILMLNYEFPPLGGGAAIQTKYLLDSFSQNEDITVDLVTSSSGKTRKENLTNNIKIHYLNIQKSDILHYQRNLELIAYSFQALNYCNLLMKEKYYDLCHAYFGIPCGFIASKLGIPYIISLCGSDVPFFSKRFWLLDRVFFRHISRRVWKEASAVIANSKGLKALALKTAKGQKIDVIYNSIDGKLFNQVSVVGKGLSEKVRLLCVSRLIKRKRLFELVKAVSQLPNIELSLVGGGPLYGKLQKIAASNINLLGEVSHHNLPKIYQNHDLFILPSENEGMSNSVLEAMACGLPVIVARTGGTDELIDGNGLVLAEISVAGIKKALIEATSSVPQLRLWGNRSLEIASRFSRTKMSSMYLAKYLQCSL